MNDNNELDFLLLKLNAHLSVFEKEEMKEKIRGYINYLLLHDFNKLISILYRVDVNEEKLKQLLYENPQTDAASIISQLLIERQQEKLRTKRDSGKDDHIPEDEKW